MVPAIGDRGRGQVKRSTHRANAWFDAVMPLALACGSTGVGNPGPAGTLSLAIVSDDDVEAAEAGAPLAANAITADAGAAPGETDVEAVTEPLPRGSLQRAVLVLGSVRWIPCDEAGEVIT